MAEEPHRRAPVIRLAISVEGQTEAEFVKTVLSDHLRPMAVDIQPILIGRARNTDQGGGNVTIDRLASEMAKLYWSFDAVTSLVDFYGFRGKAGRTVQELETDLHGEVGNRIGGRWNETKVFPYVQQYEFEGLLFADVEAFGGLIDVPDEAVSALRRMRGQFPTPEDINDERNTAPSKRIVGAIPRYRKSVHGPQVAETMGLETIRSECPRFKEWVLRLESLSD